MKKENFETIGVKADFEGKVFGFNDAGVLKVVGYLDKSNLSLFRDYIQGVIEASDERFFVLDFENLDYLNSEGIGLLMLISEELTAEGKGVVVYRPRPQVLDIFRAVGLENVIDVYKEESDCKEAVSKFLES